MTLDEFIPWSPDPVNRARLDTANALIAEYAAVGQVVTLRQIYYQFVARFPGVLDPVAHAKGKSVNRLQNYKTLGNVLNRGRLAGLVDWGAMEDRTREVHDLPSWDDPRDAMRTFAAWYHVDMWDGQDYRPEVWIEKDSLTGTIVKVCDKYDVPMFSCRGYTSQSEQYAAGQRFAETLAQGQLPLILDLHDHDPSGMDMTRDNQDRLRMFARDEEVEVRRLALNIDQIEALGLPPNPAKMTDSRATGYAAEFGEESWELDALSPRYLSDLVEEAIRDLIDFEAWDARLAYRDLGRRRIMALRNVINDDGTLIRPLAQDPDDEDEDDG